MPEILKPCRIDGCPRDAHRSKHGKGGYCSSHYQRVLRHGDAFAGKTARGDAWIFALNIVESRPWPDECVPWPFTRDTKGYGKLRWEGVGKDGLAHRMICELAHGAPATASLYATHSCGNGHEGCCNPAHLKWGTARDNHTDQKRHGTLLLGERAPNAKLTERQVLEIRGRLGTASMYALAKEYGVTEMNISAIAHGRTWKHLLPA